eukprot:scaffold24184_cov196-Skeletonema_dohrnii-CCMP3373.AAC.2
MKCDLVVYLDQQRICISCDHTDTFSRRLEVQHVTCSTWHAARGMQHLACSTRHAALGLQHSACSTWLVFCWRRTQPLGNQGIRSIDAHSVIKAMATREQVFQSVDAHTVIRAIGRSHHILFPSHFPLDSMRCTKT